MKVAVIGAGNMGLAFIRRWIMLKTVSVDSVIALEVNPNRCIQIKNELGIEANSHWENLKSCDIVFLAIKPQDFSAVANFIKPHLQSKAHIVSIMAGVTLQVIENSISGHKLLVRTMPNLPIVIGQGVTAFYAYPEVDKSKLEFIEKLLSAGGVVLRLENEELLDGVVAISGCGPAYVCYILEAALNAAKSFGLNHEQAKQLCFDTIKGTVAWLEHENVPPSELRAQVTSKAGTTEAAITHMETAQIAQNFSDALMAARLRAKQLSQGVKAS